jgi:lipid-A-disaccharide synthase
VEGENWPYIETENGLQVPIISGAQYDLMNVSDLALVTPGTVTAELAALGIPMVVVTPLNKAEEIVIDGIMNYTGKIPVVGKKIKRNAVLNVAKKMKYVAIPNKKADKYLVPEFVGVLDPPDVAFRTIEMLNDNSGRRKTSEMLKSVMGEKGASKRAAEIILKIAREVGV